MVGIRVHLKESRTRISSFKELTEVRIVAGGWEKTLCVKGSNG